LHYINKAISIEIQKKREIMISLVQKKGLSNADTIKCSQELDQLIYQYQYSFRKKRLLRGEIKKKSNIWLFGQRKPLNHNLITNKKVEKLVMGSRLFYDYFYRIL